MKSTLILGSFLLSSLAAAAPLDKRAVIWKTVTTEVVTTVEITSTIWIDPATVVAAEATSSKAYATEGAFFEKPKSSSSTAAAYTPVHTPSPSSSAAPVVSTPAYTPPAASSTPAYTPPSTTQTPAYTPTSTSAPAATSAAGSPSGTIYSGDITYYNPAGGYGSCGWTIADSDAVVALAHGIMGEQSNGNPWCGKKIAIMRNGKTYPATIGDKCMGCEGEAIDLTQGLWNIVAPDIDGRGHNIEWYVVD